MLVWETRAVKREIATGTFECPTCRDERPYRQVRAQRHGHAYRIPLVPLGEAVDYVECHGCRGTFDERILEADDDRRVGFRAAYQRGMLHVMIDLRRNDDSRRGWAGIDVVFAALAERPLADGELNRAIRDVERRETDLRHHLRRLEPHLNDVGKERIVQAAIFLSASDGLLDDRDARRVVDVARALGVTDARRRRIVAKLPN